ncbi:uncharacterized protein LOC9635402 [Selaginella moellendorffii]|nr:uncharacterized protein LOC9635402 [Selaginella moellendorffii]|eukprot:XP_002967374.2 uncharacterized protein LOC9635402 [Selaginella moellendorffii]
MGESYDGTALLLAVLGSAAAGCACAVVIRFIAGFVLAVWRSVAWILIRKKSSVASQAKQQQQQQHTPPPARKRRVSPPPPSPPPRPPAIPDQELGKKKAAPQVKPKARPTPRHRLELNAIKGHVDAITGIAFSSNSRGLATACADRVVRIFKLDDPTSKNLHVLRLNVPLGTVPTGVAFGDGPGAAQIVVATQDINGSGLLMFGAPEGKGAAQAREQGKVPPPEIKWRKTQIHDRRNVLTCVGARCEYGSGDGESVLIATCSEGTDIKIWSAGNGTCVKTVDTNQLQNTMATISPDGRFLAAAAFTADVKIWEIVYGKDGQVRDVVKVMLLKGHKSAVTWTCFTWDSQKIITASKDGFIRIWNINVRYQMDEDPKCIKVFPIPSSDNGLYEKIAVSPDDKILAATHGTTLTWLSTADGQVLDTAENAHDGEITCITWAPQSVSTDQGKVLILATASVDKKLKLWSQPL